MSSRSQTPSDASSDAFPSPPDMATLTSHQQLAVIGSFFLGPQSENSRILADSFEVVVDEIEAGRMKYFPADPSPITEEMIQDEHAQQSVIYLKTLLSRLSGLLAQHSTPFFSPRYAAHMNSDLTLPGILGYLVGMLYNQNNVAPEGGPLTTHIEYGVCQDLCYMLGYDIPHAWGHLTSGGSIANLESMWVARNLKYYPLSLKSAMLPGQPLSFASWLETTLCDGRRKAFRNCTTWELLNLTPKEILDLPGRLSSQFSIPISMLENILEPYSIQSVGKAQLDLAFNIVEPPQYLISPANHYSWAKGTAITGIGRDNLISLKVDLDARMDTQDLRRCLDEHLERRQAVYAVVVIAGTTEHGAVDPISEVVEIRKEYQAKGLSFMIHADAAWGGYFATKASIGPEPIHECAFSLELSEHTNRELCSLRHVDSVTLDPHKSGYIPYPGGGICYGDGRLRFLVRWTSPVLNTGGDDPGCVGIYGIEGSSPGARATATFVSHEVVGLDRYGYGSLLGTAMFNAVKMYMHWATTSMDSTSLIVTPLKMLDAERKSLPDSAEVRKAKERIRYLLSLSSSELEGHKKELAELGSDLVVNSFTCNFYIDGEPNQDVAEANYLNTRIYKRLSIQKPTDNVYDRPLIIYSTKLRQKGYGSCLTNFKNRLGLDPDDGEDLVALSNTSMSPFPTANSLVTDIMKAFKEVAEEEIALMLERRSSRWTFRPCVHAFLLQGTDELHLVHFAIFNIADYRQQIVAVGRLDAKPMEVYKAAFEANPKEPLVIFTAENEDLTGMIERGHFVGDIYHGSPFRYGDSDYKPIFAGAKVTLERTIKRRSIYRRDLPNVYPEKMPFYLYGTPAQQHIEHMLLRAPNVQLCATNVELWLYPELPPEYLKAGVIAVMEDVHEHIRQPFGKSNEPDFFSAGKKFNITVYEDETDYLRGPKAALARGTLTLGPAVWRDYININREGDEESESPQSSPHTTLPFQRAAVASDLAAEEFSVMDAIRIPRASPSLDRRPWCPNFEDDSSSDSGRSL